MRNGLGTDVCWPSVENATQLEMVDWEHAPFGSLSLIWILDVNKEDCLECMFYSTILFRFSRISSNLQIVLKKLSSDFMMKRNGPVPS